MRLRVEWNRQRSIANLQERGVSFVEAATVLSDPLSRTIADPGNDKDAARFVTLGLSHRARMLVVSHLDRGSAVWILEARRAIQTTDAGAKAQPRAEYDFSNGARGRYASRYWHSAAEGVLTRR